MDHGGDVKVRRRNRWSALRRPGPVCDESVMGEFRAWEGKWRTSGSGGRTWDCSLMADSISSRHRATKTSRRRHRVAPGGTLEPLLSLRTTHSTVQRRQVCRKRGERNSPLTSYLGFILRKTHARCASVQQTAAELLWAPPCLPQLHQQDHVAAIASLRLARITTLLKRRRHG